MKASAQDAMEIDQNSKSSGKEDCMIDECDLSNLVLVDTTKCILWEDELKGCIATKKPTLTKKHLKGRLSW